MVTRSRTILETVLSEVPDPRSPKRAKLHNLVDILVIVVAATLSRVEGWHQIVLFAKSKIDFFRGILELPNGIPCPQTFGRVLARVDPQGFMDAFHVWAEGLREFVDGEQIGLDGKRIRGASDRLKGKGKPPIHVVSAWAAENRLCLGQRTVADKHNEIEAMLGLIKILEIKNTTVSIDAMGCQKEIAAAIVDRKANYILALKANHKNLHSDVQLFFEDLKANTFPGLAYDTSSSTDKDHGRIETRRVWATSDIEWLEQRTQWKGLSTIVMVESRRKIGTKTTTKTRYYLTSLPPEARRLGKYIRRHWHIENRLHWTLDVAFGEDRDRAYAGYAAENFALIRKLAINLLRRESSKKESVPCKRLLATIDNDYLLKVLMA
jgi:predicted transposase YbfD/YdcC